MAQLNGIVHPLVARERTAMVHACEEQGASLVVIDVPLLFETKGESTVDATLVVTCSPEEQRRCVRFPQSIHRSNNSTLSPFPNPPFPFLR
mmetsp:Transcript_1335/g.2995  ORF Transcript_1335/g.2995 Transcript_1335/m.2995 type:complete len:91 (+) Transcript_1335:431-703(+)